MSRRSLSILVKEIIKILFSVAPQVQDPYDLKKDIKHFAILWKITIWNPLKLYNYIKEKPNATVCILVDYAACQCIGVDKGVVVHSVPSHFLKPYLFISTNIL